MECPRLLAPLLSSPIGPVRRSIALSDPAQQEGGVFLTWRDKDTPIEHRCGQGDGVLFRSEDYHNVTPVTKGTRSTLVMELWAGPTNRVDRNH